MGADFNRIQGLINKAIKTLSEVKNRSATAYAEKSSYTWAAKDST